MTAQVFDATNCELGEGPLWHPGLGQLFWFDITGKKLLTRRGGETRHWDLPEMFSAAGWIDDETLFMCSETAFWRFSLATGGLEKLRELESGNSITRSNDGRADPEGGFWIGTMGKNAEPRAGTIYRYHRGEVRLIAQGVTIPNGICFAPDGHWAYWADSARSMVFRQRLGARGWPTDDPETFLDLRGEKLTPDGAVTDARGHYWSAQWGAWRVAEYDTAGSFVRALDIPAAHSSCPAFGGPDLTTLYCTSAMQGIPAADRAAEPGHGRTFLVENVTRGLPEPRVVP